MAFDRGNGSGTVSRLLFFGTYATGVDTSSRGLDLFRTDVPSPPTGPVDVAGPVTEASAPTAVAKGGNNRVREALQTAEKQKELAGLLKSLQQSKP